MKKQMFSVFDSKSGIYSQPFTSINLGTALRDFSAACNDKGTELHKYPLDFSLMHIAEFDDDTGTITPINPANLGLAQQYLSLE